MAQDHKYGFCLARDAMLVRLPDSDAIVSGSVAQRALQSVYLDAEHPNGLAHGALGASSDSGISSWALIFHSLAALLGPVICERLMSGIIACWSSAED